MTPRDLTRLTLYYPVSYLLPAGAMMLVAPEIAFRLCFSSQPEAYGDVMPRMAGALTFGLGVIVLQSVRLRLDALHSTIVGVRVFFVAVWLGLWSQTRDPFFLVLAALVGLGTVLTGAAILRERAMPPAAGA